MVKKKKVEKVKSIDYTYTRHMSIRVNTVIT